MVSINRHGCFVFRRLRRSRTERRKRMLFVRGPETEEGVTASSRSLTRFQSTVFFTFVWAEAEVAEGEGVGACVDGAVLLDLGVAAAEELDLDGDALSASFFFRAVDFAGGGTRSTCFRPGGLRVGRVGSMDYLSAKRRGIRLFSMQM